MVSGYHGDEPYNTIDVNAPDEETLREAMTAIQRALRDVEGASYGGPF